MEMLEAGKIALKEAGEKIGVSYRKANWIGRAIKEKGIRVMVHGNTGRLSGQRPDERAREQILELSKRRYGEFNDSHFTEHLSKREGYGSSGRRFGRYGEESIVPKHRRRIKKFHKRRERKGLEGLRASNMNFIRSSPMSSRSTAYFNKAFR